MSVPAREGTSARAARARGRLRAADDLCAQLAATAGVASRAFAAWLSDSTGSRLRMVGLTTRWSDARTLISGTPAKACGGTAAFYCFEQ